ncbi:SPOR domain-containing protein [Sediminimonas sp.]|uniref:SPOR domain-containing protein n=1 Tax=Sediminimonas sp. TaxID=2823379 RepID=UPI0025F4EE91|nr:SPOR domain-containing protein [Sediminimonas sp.]
MADMQATGRMEATEGGQTLTSWANWIGAAISLVLLVGVVNWGYQLLVRDVHGVPVVRATEGPMRVQPDDPGGKPADYMGLAVNNVAAKGAAEAPADRLVLAPPPLNLSEEDVPAAALSAAEKDTAATDVPGDMGALIDELVAEATPLSPGGQDDEAEVTAASAAEVVDTAEAEPPADSPEPVAGLGRSLRPQVRPEQVVARLAAADGAPTANATADATPVDVDPASIAPGTRLVQLGAFDSDEVARSEWGRLSSRFNDYLAGKKRVIQRAESGGRVFYRLRAMGFADLADARRFCSALVAENADCIPVVTR